MFWNSNLIKNPALYDFTSSFTGGQSRINASVIVGYRFSETLKANFEYSFRKLIPKSTGIFPRTDHDILFNVIVSIRSGGKRLFLLAFKVHLRKGELGGLKN